MGRCNVALYRASDTAGGDFYSAGTGDTVVDMAGDISGEISPTAPAAKVTYYLPSSSPHSACR